MKRFLMLTILTAFATAQAQTFIAGTGNKIAYIKEKDAITDENQSAIFIREVNDTTTDTVAIFFCRKGQPQFYLSTKNMLLTQEDYDAEVTPNLIYRVDAQQPKPVETASVSDDDGPKLTAIAATGSGDQTLFTAFKNAQSKVVIRVMRNGLSELTYTFATKGFTQAAKLVNNCQ
ncbi:hypothetical protein [Deinococcus sp. 23YEL01]|uniref:hypothetical protein n=1 Tax=Deinococcus sp. 23YEL01 TaxID=2745871 RepID=UPI001E4E2837|nr:hypothetical protein [Deinococcus sp. 23YEL01]MCD0168620.1 hypothetical protein [Deinococcus sp. 23YEL01]